MFFGMRRERGILDVVGAQVGARRVAQSPQDRDDQIEIALHDVHHVGIEKNTPTIAEFGCRDTTAAAAGLQSRVLANRHTQRP
ncbi:hypothetical protein D3C78_1799440 [compost metagenome]